MKRKRKGPPAYNRQPSMRPYFCTTCPTAEEAKFAASGLWIHIFRNVDLLIDVECSSPRECPACGANLFRTFLGTPTHGAVLCHMCHNTRTNPSAGDGLSTLQWRLELDLDTAVRRLRTCLTGCAYLRDDGFMHVEASS